jgi:hypothetical protein
MKVKNFFFKKQKQPVFFKKKKINVLTIKKPICFKKTLQIGFFKINQPIC